MRTENILFCAMLAAGEPLSIDRLIHLFPEEAKLNPAEILNALELLKTTLLPLGLQLKEVATGFCLQLQPEFQPVMAKLFEKRPPKYSRALLETLALLAYRQPITRAEIEDIRGVAVSSHIFKILMEREWIRIIGHKDVPGKPALYATTKLFLDHFNLKSLQELPPLISFTSEENTENTEILTTEIIS